MPTATTLKNRPNNGDFAMLILTHGRADNVKTIDTLAKCGYTGRIVIVIDDEDSQAQQYFERFGQQVYQFNKQAVAEYTDEGYHNHIDRRSITYARNVSFQVAKDLGITYFMMLDDDYCLFQYKYNAEHQFVSKPIRDLDAVLSAMVKFFAATPKYVLSVAFAQGGDYIGGNAGNSPYAKSICLRRKCMNTFLCSTERPYLFSGVFNEDVNTYTTLSQRGNVFFTLSQVSINQTETQSNPGGITELYQKFGTYVKAFYSVMYSPSSVKVSMMQSSNSRIHHRIVWNNTAPKILDERYRKPRTQAVDG